MFNLTKKNQNLYALFHHSILVLPLDRRQETVGFGPVVDVAGPQVISKETNINQCEHEQTRFPLRGQRKSSGGDRIVPNGVPVGVVVDGQVGVVVLGERRPHCRDVTATVVWVAEEEGRDPEVRAVLQESHKVGTSPPV